ncbi:MAG: XRE family transcriptional regulator [Rhodobacter sp.]|nr:XRE family transcriptional regulator [Rhodobacter sp.]
MAEQDVNAKIGQALRRLRRDKALTVTQLASMSQVSPGMISRIENGQVSPSLSTLDALARGLQVQLMSLFAHTSDVADVHYVAAGTGLASRRITPGHAHDYMLLGRHVDRGGTFDAARVTIRRDQASDLPRYQHEGHVFLFVILGEATYTCGGESFALAPGASLSFDAKLSHGFAEIHSDAVSMITVSSRPV